MNDAAITARFRVIAFDLPWHGKSSPPAGFEREEYRLTSAGYAEAIRGFAAALGLERPAVMGCSIGGRIVLSSRDPPRRRIPRADRARGRGSSGAVVRHGRGCIGPDIHGGEVCAGLVSGLIAPQSPESRALGDAVALPAGRARRLQGRSLFLSRRCRSARRGRQDRHARLLRSISSPANTTSPARPRTRCAPRRGSPAPRSR